VQNLRARAHADNLAFQLVRAKLRATMDESIDGARSAVNFFTTQTTQKTYTSIAAAYLGLSYAHLLSKNVVAAEAAYARIPRGAIGVSHPMIDTLAARIRQTAGDNDGAVKLLRASAARYPQLRHVQLSLVDGLQSAGRHDEALALLREQAQLYRTDPKVFEMQAKSYAATGKRMAQHQALGEHYVLLGALQPAIEQFQIARCEGDGDFYQQSIIDARIRTLWETLVADRTEQQKAADQGPADGARRRPPSIAQGVPGRC
jgi:beta-barrel assembly-enhancing protease